MFILLLIIIFIYLVNRWWFKDTIKLYERFKTDIRSWPIVGHALWFMGTSEDRMNAFKTCGLKSVENGGIASFWLTHKLYLMIADPMVAEMIFKSTPEKDDLASFLRLVIGNGILFAPGAIWRPRRKIMAPTFSQKNLNHFVDTFAKQSHVLTEKLKTVSGKGDFPIWQYITCYTMDSVCENTLGFNMNSQTNPDGPFFRAFETCCQLVIDRMVQPWFYSSRIYRLTPYHSALNNSINYVHSFVKKIIEAKREELARSSNKKDINDNEGPKDETKSFLELLIESSGKETGYSDIELQEESLVLLLGGTDTSAVGISFTILMLAKHQDIQEKVYQELLDVFGESDRPVTHEDIPRLKYLEAVIKESLRFYPPVPILIPKLVKSLTLPSGITIPPETGLVVNIWAMHHSPKEWGDDVEEFKPERFIDTKPNPAYIPFSTGLRTCIGYRYTLMSMTTVLATLVRRYKFLPAACTQNGVPLRLKYEVMMKDVDNYLVKIEARTNIKPII